MFSIILKNFHLEKILWIIKTKLIYMILVGALAATAVALVGTEIQSSRYMAEVQFYAYTSPDYVDDSDASQSAAEVSQARTLLASYMQIIKSKNFLNSVLEKAEYDMSVSELSTNITAEAVENTAAFYVRVYNEDPLMAMEIANTIGELAPDEIIRIVKSGGIETIQWAELPTEPFEQTSVIKLSLLGGILGFVLAAMFFFFRGLLDTKIRRKYEIEDLFTIPIIASVPNMLPHKKKEKVRVVLDNDSPFAVKEAYSDMRASMMFMSKGEKCPVFAFTSADQNEGKSLTTFNTAVSYAGMGKKVLLIDADMRKSRMKNLVIEKNEMLDGNMNGLSELLAGINEDNNIFNCTENFDIILSGKNPPNPAELLGSERFDAFIEKWKQEYDVIFIDLPPVGMVSDALAIINNVTAFILVVKERVTRFEREEMIVRKLEKMNANIGGIVYNGISVKSPDYNYKTYGDEAYN